MCGEGIEVKYLNVEIQKNGIVRNLEGWIIGRLNSDVAFDILKETNRQLQTKEVNMEKQAITTKKTVEELINSQDCPLPLNVIPNNMGINLCSVDTIEWTKQADGQLVNLQINFIPANTEFYEWLLQKGYRMRNGKIIKYPSLEEISDSEVESLQNEYQRGLDGN